MLVASRYIGDYYMPVEVHEIYTSVYLTSGPIYRFGPRLHSGTDEVYQIEVKSDNGAICGSTLRPLSVSCLSRT